MSVQLEGRVAVVSGAAVGLGRAAAIRLAKEGATIEILDLKDASPVVNEIKAAGGKAFSTLCDCIDEAQVDRAAKNIEARQLHRLFLGHQGDESVDQN